ncbi:ubiquitin-protein ligase [Lithospermum erythrorhizon]|uniref:RING-type E3 ubiquitin transferase n=1 Tax=Lithospermum erythrorhizon TaxID=34254 RepID=A0AAV3RD01_LITER
MGLPLAPTTPHLYSPSLQLKLYQAFIFSIPILFSIILFLLFYLFYLKRRNSSSSSLPLSRTSRSSTQVVSSNSLALMGLKGILKEKLPVILYDGNSRMKETQCCVCLGEFELKEEVNQLASCQHIFHKDCIHHWFHSSSTCPLCRCPVVIINPKTIHQQQPPDLSTSTSVQDNNNENINLNHQQQVQDHDDDDQQEAQHV